jgi:hypothetical protein
VVVVDSVAVDSTTTNPITNTTNTAIGMDGAVIARLPMLSWSIIISRTQTRGTLGDLGGVPVRTLGISARPTITVIRMAVR